MTLKGHLDSVYSVAVSLDGSLIASASGDYTVRLWNTETGASVGAFEGHTNYAYTVCFSPDSSLVASGSRDASVRLWSTAPASTEPLGFRAAVSAVAVSSKWVAVGADDKTLALYAVADGVLARTINGHTDNVCAVAISADDTKVVSGAWDKTARIWSMSTGMLLHVLEGHADWVGCVGFSPDASLVVTGGDDHSVRLWRASDGRLLRELLGHTRFVEDVCFSLDAARVLSVGGDGVARVWVVADGKEEAHYPKNHVPSAVHGQFDLIKARWAFQSLVLAAEGTVSCTVDDVEPLGALWHQGALVVHRGAGGKSVGVWSA